jgi:hypothetical protein
MMKIFLINFVKQLKNHSATIDNSNILVDKPWALIDDEFELQKLIFKKNKELILSKNGQVQIGRWEYFPEAKSLLIDRNVDKILCNEAFINNGVMILKLDGTDNRFFILANENVIPDLDAYNYLKNLRNQKLLILETNLSDGRTLEVQRKNDFFQEPIIGNFVSFNIDGINSSVVEDGIYKLSSEDKYYEIKKSKIYRILKERKYVNPENQEIIIQQQYYMNISQGDYVYMSGNKIENSIINFSDWTNLVVEKGVVKGIEWKNSTLRWISNLISVK